MMMMTNHYCIMTSTPWCVPMETLHSCSSTLLEVFGVLFSAFCRCSEDFWRQNSMIHFRCIICNSVYSISWHFRHYYQYYHYL